MKILLGCVNSAVSLVGYDLETHQPFWYCPGNRLRACGVHFYENALWVSSDSTLKKIAHDGITVMELPGPHENFAHSVKPLGEDCIGVVDTGNSRVTIFSGGRCVTHYSPLENWPFEIPCDAIHLNDILPWKDGILASAFSYQPFQPNKDSCPTWNSDGLGVLFYMRKYKNNLISTIIASGLNCPHSITEYNGDIYCCSSSTGTFYRLRQNIAGILTQDAAWHVTETHFLRGCLRVDSGWILGGSSQRFARDDEKGGMVLFHLSDAGAVTQYPVAGVGEIYDIIPWDGDIMRDVAEQVLRLPDMPLEGTFPAPCTAFFA